MTRLWTLLSALLLVLSVAQPEENENEVLKNTELEFTNSQASDFQFKQDILVFAVLVSLLEKALELKSVCWFLLF